MHLSANALIQFTQIRISSLGFGTTTMPAPHSVGVSTLLITPNFSILASSALTFGSNRRATLLEQTA